MSQRSNKTHKPNESTPVETKQVVELSDETPQHKGEHVVVWSMLLEPYYFVMPTRRYGDRSGGDKDRSTQNNTNKVVEIKHGRNIVARDVWDHCTASHPVAKRLVGLGKFVAGDRTQLLAVEQRKVMSKGNNPISRTEHFMVYDGESAKTISEKLSERPVMGLEAFEPGGAITGAV